MTMVHSKQFMIGLTIPFIYTFMINTQIGASVCVVSTPDIIKLLHEMVAIWLPLFG